MAGKLERQIKIKEILTSRAIKSQDKLEMILKASGVKVTQATLSRDFAELGVVRTTTDKGVRYVLNPNESGSKIAQLVGFEILSVRQNESLILIRTLAGRAQGVAHYFDRLNIEEIMGTVGGDDTVLVIPNKQKNIPLIINLVNNLMINNK